MKAMRWKFRAICGTASLILGGCWTPAPYGYSTYPGYNSPPNQGFVAPPGAVLSPGVTIHAPIGSARDAGNGGTGADGRRRSLSPPP